MVRALTRHDELTHETDKATVVRLARRQARPRRLLLCLDGVPLEIVRAAKGRGLFDNFEAPSCLLSPFSAVSRSDRAAAGTARPTKAAKSSGIPRSFDATDFTPDSRSRRRSADRWERTAPR
jgi:hypothetical protein